ncbi:hypothetical protein [Melittangium boletus]|uniref:Heme exporter protein D n=1 Tax=Melittangium boletus DSM 14713 TaxID=1294270 RepID=A0A250ISN4_9BACT|nr:hypothetical protein [Melittangium boletus]ATB34268.1 hypothetical protein MEBOL_007769 [Melittangium boletus DSM 14713]
MSALYEVSTAVLAQVGEGRIKGGWGYIWSSYAIAWGSLALYGLSLWMRRPGKAEHDSAPPPSVSPSKE